MDSEQTYHVKKKEVSGRNNWRKVSRDKFVEIAQSSQFYEKLCACEVLKSGFSNTNMEGEIRNERKYRI